MLPRNPGPETIHALASETTVRLFFLPVIFKIVPAGPSVGDRLVTDSIVHVVERYSPGADAVGTVRPQALAFNVVDGHDGVGRGTTDQQCRNCSMSLLPHTCWSTVQPLSRVRGCG